jgi:hypothetical protein
MTLKYEVENIIEDDSVYGGRILVYYRHGERHRVYDPAVLWADGVFTYYRYGNNYGGILC